MLIIRLKRLKFPLSALSFHLNQMRLEGKGLNRKILTLGINLKP